MRILKSHSAENSEKRGTFWDFLTFFLLQNIKKNERTFWGHLKNFEKKSHKAEKSQCRKM